MVRVVVRVSVRGRFRFRVRARVRVVVSATHKAISVASLVWYMQGGYMTCRTWA